MIWTQLSHVLSMGHTMADGTASALVPHKSSLFGEYLSTDENAYLRSVSE